MAKSSRTLHIEPMLKKRDPDELVFSLDIGTRSVVGIVAETTDDGLHILDYEQIEHPGRAMTDGQVEDIKAVSLTIAKVKSTLEARLGVTLRSVAVAAAGRTLKTVRTKLERELPSNSAIDRDFVLGMESEAIEQAQQTIQNNDAPASMRFYFVGYSIVAYTMDSLAVSSLIGHTATKATVELIAAFLPFSVIESLYAAVESCALSVVSLTLEPIAAMNVLIPPELRLLNLALVDIGAGTSDIAICREGAVCAYEMATIAGDELTESIIKTCLVNFETAERLKRELGGEEATLEYDDVLYIHHQLSRRELLASIEPSVDLLAKTIAERILLCNSDVPAAVFVIGGGSQIPGLGEKLASYLKLDPSRISAGKPRPLRGVASDFDVLSGPEFVTPIGIALTSVTQQSFQFWGVSVNGKPLKLLITREMRMIDLLLMAGYQTTQILGRAGRNLLFYLDGEQQLVKGTLPEHARLSCNEKEASVDTLIYPGDRITFTPAINGEDAVLCLGDVCSESLCGMVQLCSHPYRIGTWADINGRYAPVDTVLEPQDHINSHRVLTLGELLLDAKLSIDATRLYCGNEALNDGVYLCDGMDITLPSGGADEELLDFSTSAETGLPIENETLATTFTGDKPLKPEDKNEAPSARSSAGESGAETETAALTDAADVSIESAASVKAPVDASPHYDFGADEDELYGDEDEEEEAEGAWPEPAPSMARKAAQSVPLPALLSLTLNGKAVKLPIDGEHPHYYVMNLLGICGLDLQKPKGNVAMRVNGANAAFSRILSSGDVVEIGWS